MTFEERRNSLSGLVSLIEEKQAEFEGVLSSFSELVEQSFHNVEARAHDISGLLNQTTQETAQLVDERFSAIRSAANSERARTAAALHAAYEQANSELTSVFGQASEKFNAAATEIRGLAQEIQRELEETRQEVRRGAVELPRETAEQASALRRVVGNQVKALNELTNIVARSGRVYDIAEPNSASARRAFEAPARVAEAVRNEPGREAPRVRPTTTPAPRATTVRPEAANGGQGWLSDLLARASRDEADPTPTTRAARSQSSGALDNLTLDIARMVDNAAVAELWRRFQRGERDGLFTRRLYTSQGHQTLEEIRRRYRADQDFRGTIDHYIRNFEELLTETGRTDRDGGSSLDLLTGEAGKVYTMLGHAAGRFE